MRLYCVLAVAGSSGLCDRGCVQDQQPEAGEGRADRGYSAAGARHVGL